jgi:hypothetical protein
VLAGEAHPAGEPTDVGVDHDALSQIEGIPQNHIGRLSAHAWELVQVLHGPGNLSAMILDQGGGTSADGFRLGAEKPGRANQALQLGGWNPGKVLGGAATGKESGRNLIDPLIGALGGQNGGDEELERVGVVQLAVG